MDKKQLPEELPLAGYNDRDKNKIKFIDYLSDEQLQEINKILNWNCFVIDSKGRRFGDRASEKKRNIPQPIPDPRIVLMNEKFNLSDKSILEIGCFEGIHTIALSMYAKKVIAFDSRIENIIKTIVRCALFDYHPTVFQYDIEKESADPDWLKADLMHHVGVLYHLANPVEHLLKIGQYIHKGMMLDTHYALDELATETYEVNGKKYNYKIHREKGYTDVFSGMSNHAKWLTLNDITILLEESGFSDIEIVEKREERNGPRILMFAQKKHESRTITLG
jgi:tRNA (mo5U34)-methyltransferase